MKTFKELGLILLIMVLSSKLLMAQDYLNVLNFRFYYLPVTSLESNSEKTTFREFRIETALPYTCEDGNIFGIKPQYKTFILSSNDTLKDLHVHSIKMPLFAIIKFKNPKWSAYFDVSPKLNSDLTKVKLNHFQIGGTLLMFYESKKDLFWQFGVYYNQEAFGAYPMLLLGVDWKIDQKNYATILLPAYMMYERKLSKKFYTGFEMEITDETYRLGGSDYKNSYISDFGKSKYSAMLEPRFFIDYYIAKHLVLYAKPGMRFLQKYEQYDENDNRLVHSDYVQGKLNDCFYIEVGLAMRFRYDEEKAAAPVKSEN